MLPSAGTEPVAGVSLGDDFEISGIPAHGVFVPGADTGSTHLLLERLWRRRQASFLAGGLGILQNYPALASETGFAHALEAYRSAPSAVRRIMMEHPCFRIWIRKMIELPPFDRFGEEDADALRALLMDGVRIVHARYVPGYAVRRFDLDPLLAAAIPPSYSFDELDAKVRREALNPYSIEFAEEVVSTALRRIGEIWPEARSDFDRFVKVVVHLPDLESRSCSAARFAGAILLSSCEDMLLSVEESLVHECGHQILYCVMELDPLVVDTGKKTFRLPWSGSERDAYGYLHATYIYVILALYFERVVDSERKDRDAARSRLAAILSGLKRAVDDFEGADFFSEKGKVFFDRLVLLATSIFERNLNRMPEALSLEDEHGEQ